MGNNTIDQYIEVILGKECSVCPHNARCEKGLTCDKNKDYQKMIMAGAEWQKQRSYTDDQIKQAILDYCDENGMDDEEAKECVDDFINNFLNKNK